MNGWPTSRPRFVMVSESLVRQLHHVGGSALTSVLRVTFPEKKSVRDARTVVAEFLECLAVAFGTHLQWFDISYGDSRAFTPFWIEAYRGPGRPLIRTGDPTQVAEYMELYDRVSTQAAESAAFKAVMNTLSRVRNSAELGAEGMLQLAWVAIEQVVSGCMFGSERDSGQPRNRQPGAKRIALKRLDWVACSSIVERFLAPQEWRLGLNMDWMRSSWDVRCGVVH